MALQVWLPCTDGTLKNLGIYNTTISSTSFASNNNGKLGKCIKCNTTSMIDTQIPSSVWDFTTKSISFGAWIKINQTELAQVTSTSTYSGNYTTAGGTVLGRQAYGGLGLRWRTNNLTENTTPTNIYLYVYIRNTSSGIKLTSLLDFPFDTWVHIFVVFNREALTMSIYKDGLLYNSITISMSTYATTGNISLGTFLINLNSWDGGNGSPRCAPWYMNDIRIYDHALSPKEVKEISQGLVLHYKLNQNLNVLDNCYNNPTFNTSTASGGWSHWAPSGSSGSYSQNTNKDFIYNKNNTYSHKVSCTSGNYYICYLSPTFSGGYRSALAIIKMSDGSNPVGKVAFSHNANVGVNPPNTFTYLGDGFYLMKHEGFRLDGSNDLVSIYIPSGNTVYISEAYLENNREVCSDIFNLNNLTTIYDSSGYLNNGIVTGSLTMVSDSSRYNMATHFNSSSYIRVENRPAEILPKDSITVNVWVKYSTWGNPISCTESGGWNFENGGTGIGIRFPLYILSVGYKTASSGILPTELSNAWHMITGVFNRTQVKIYIDGDLKGTTETNSTNPISYANNYLFISAEARGNYDTPLNSSYVGDKSDLRIYATALSDEDIKELYDTSAIIDNDGNTYCYLYEELMENVELNVPLWKFNKTSNPGGISFDGKDLVFTGYLCASYSEYIEVDITKTFYYDITYSSQEGSRFLIGFEKYDENKASTSNSGCVYIISTGGDAADKIRKTGTFTFGTINGNPCKYTKIRVLSCWTNSTIRDGVGKIHSFHFALVDGTGNSEVTKQGLIKTGWFIEDELLLTLISKNKYMTTSELIEI